MNQNAPRAAHAFFNAIGPRLPFTTANGNASAWLSFQMRRNRQPGCVLAVGHRGRIVFERSYGYANAVTGERLTPRHRFRVASHSKSFTAAAILKLRESG